MLKKYEGKFLYFLPNSLSTENYKSLKEICNLRYTVLHQIYFFIKENQIDIIIVYYVFNFSDVYISTFYHENHIINNLIINLILKGNFKVLNPENLLTHSEEIIRKLAKNKIKINFE